MNADINPMLDGWDYDPTQVKARYIHTPEGETFIQLRLDLGLFQMVCQGRPDGSQPHGYASLLDYYKAMEETDKQSKRMEFTQETCAELQQEAVQYYYRYLARFALNDYDGVIDDTRHNLELFELVSRHTKNEDVAWEFLQFKPYVCMMSARAIAEKMSAQDNYKAAVAAIEEAVEQIQLFWLDQGEYELTHDCYELEVLDNMLKQLKERRPTSETEKLQVQLEHAVKQEDFERAAKLRDQLQSLNTKP